MQYSYLSQINYCHCKEDPNFLSTNYNNNSGGEQSGIAVLIVLPNGKKFPILIGELKAKVHFQELSFDPKAKPSDQNAKPSDYLQLFNYMLTLQRPYRVNDSESQLLGFLMDYEKAFLFRLRVGFWTDDFIVPSITEFLLFLLLTISNTSFLLITTHVSLLTAGENIEVKKCVLHRSSFVRDCYMFFHELLAEISSELSQLEPSDFERLSASRSPTIRFPPMTPLVPPFDKLPAYTLPIRKRDFESNKSKWFPTTDMSLEFEWPMRSVRKYGWLVLKACAKLLSGGWSDQDQLYYFLQMCNNLPEGSSLKKLIVEKLYLGVYTICDKPGICFALTRYLPYQKCSSEKFARCWSDNRKTAATAFVEQVFAVALEAIENGFYHWDI